MFNDINEIINLNIEIAKLINLLYKACRCQNGQTR